MTSATPGARSPRRSPRGTGAPAGQHARVPASGRRSPLTSSSTAWWPAPATPARPTISPGARRSSVERLAARPSTRRVAQLEPAAAADLDRPLGDLLAQLVVGPRRPSRSRARRASRRRSPGRSARRAAARSSRPSPSRSTVTSSHSAITSSRMCETNTTPTWRSRSTRSIVEQHLGARRARAPRSARRGSARAARSAAPWRSRAAGARRACSSADRRAQRRRRGRARRAPAARAAAISARVDERPAPRLAHREEVREHVEVREQVELLRDDRDAVAHGLGGGGEADRAGRRGAASPASGASAPAMIFTSVDLPAPFSPSSACTEPARTVKSAPASATTPP